KSTIRGSSAIGILSMQKKPMSSNALTAMDLPAPDSPVTMRKFIPHPSFSFYYTDLPFQNVPGSFPHDPLDFFGQRHHVRAGRAAPINDKAAVFFTDLCAAHREPAQTAFFDQTAGKRPLRPLESTA